MSPKSRPLWFFSMRSGYGRKRTLSTQCINRYPFKLTLPSQRTVPNGFGITIKDTGRMPKLPHNFPTLRQKENGNYRPSVLLLGAGASYKQVPLTGALLKDKRTTAECKLGFQSTLPFSPSPPAEDLYKWADDIFNQLSERGDSNPKLTLAKSLDIPVDTSWRGGISSRRNNPVHRVIARFAREGLWDQIWSLNWDCLQESAFESVGIKRGIPDASDAGLPWPTIYRTFVTVADCAGMGEPYSVKVVKPHGCVMALKDAEDAMNHGDFQRSRSLAERFMITKTELGNMKPKAGDNGTQHFIFSTLCEKLCSLPFVIVGWSAQENYILEHIELHVRPALDARDLADDELSIIVPTFRETNGGHARLASCYRKDKDNVHIQVEREDGFTMNEFFLWLQAIYAVGRLYLYSHDNDKESLAELTTAIQQPPDTPAFVNAWSDKFLPVWVRLCWRCGFVKCRKRDNQMVSAEDINLESPDEHIPLFVTAIDRPELTSAARLLAALHRSGNGCNWNYEKFPGGLFQDGHLAIPLPAWAGMLPDNLCGLKPLIEAITQEGLGFIDKLSILPLCPDPVEALPVDMVRVLKEVIARELPLAHFAQSSHIEEIKLEDL